MFTLGAITFLSPWLLAALSVLPVLWFILRVTPPRPKTVILPSFFLLKDIGATLKAAARTPWWLLLLRLIIVALLIFAFSDPVLLRAEKLPGNGNVFLSIDNGWASASHWTDRMKRIEEYLSRIDREKRSVVLLPTAPSAEDGKVRATDVMNAADALKWLTKLVPQPWESDYAEAVRQAGDVLANRAIGHSVFFSDGLEKAETADFLKALRDKSSLAVVHDDKVNDAFILRRDTAQKDMVFTLDRARPSQRDEKMALLAYAGEGNLIDAHSFVFPAGHRNAEVPWEMSEDLRGKVTRVEVKQQPMASAVFLTDSNWRRRPVGILADPAQKNSTGFLNEIYYLRRALEKNGDVTIDAQAVLAEKELAAVIWPDSAALTAVERVNLLAWVEKGGFLVRFAGPNLAANAADPLLPVALRNGQRAMQGAMTWEKPLHLGAIPEESPLAGLAVPKDVNVLRQILADSSPETLEKTWLQLEDGTPLMTGGKIGKGTVVLVHTTAGPEWSNFCYSGLYVESLQRMISLSAGIAGYKAEKMLAPMMLMNGFGQVSQNKTGSIAGPVDPAKTFVSSPQTPPGIYGQTNEFQVFNLGDALGSMQEISDLPSGATEETYALSGEVTLKRLLLAWALLLLVADTVATFFLRGIFSNGLRRAAAAIVVLALLSAPAQAQVVDETELASSIYLAYVETGDSFTDQVSYNGLTALQEVVNARTNIKIAGVRGVDPSKDALLYYPVLYWPMTEAQTALSMTAARNLQDYMARGGMILIDTRDQQFASPSSGGSATPGALRLRKLTENIQIAELMPVAEGHILSKSFYLLDDFPGMYAGGKIWVEKEPSPNYDAVTSIIVGGNDWAAAWSMDPEDRARFTPDPGGENQREMAYRTGVNILMAALAGNYKADQVHVPYILERMKR